MNKIIVKVFERIKILNPFRNEKAGYFLMHDPDTGEVSAVPEASILAKVNNRIDGIIYPNAFTKTGIIQRLGNDITIDADEFNWRLSLNPYSNVLFETTIEPTSSIEMSRIDTLAATDENTIILYQGEEVDETSVAIPPVIPTKYLRLTDIYIYGDDVTETSDPELEGKEDSSNKTDDETTSITNRFKYFSVKGFWNAFLNKIFPNTPAKSTVLIDTDVVLIGDSEDSFKTKTRTFLQFFTNLKTRFDLLYAPKSDSFSKIVYVNSIDPNSATIFDLNNPPATNDDSLKSNVANLYIATDSSTWVYSSSSSTYETKVVSTSISNFYLAGTTIDAGNSKTASIERSGNVKLKGASTTTGDVLELQDSAGDKLIGFGNNKTFFIPKKTIFLFDRTGDMDVANSPRLRFYGDNIITQDLYGEQGKINVTKGFACVGQLSIDGTNSRLLFGTKGGVNTVNNRTAVVFSEISNSTSTGGTATVTMGASSVISVSATILGFSRKYVTPVVMTLPSEYNPIGLETGGIGVYMAQILNARKNNDVLIGNVVKPNYADNGCTGVTHIAHGVDVSDGFGYYQKGVSVDNYLEGNLQVVGLTKLGQYTTATRPAFQSGYEFFDTTLNKKVIGGATAWEVVSSS